MNANELNESIFSKIQDIDVLAKNIYQQILSESKGLNAKLTGDVSMYDDTQISPSMQGVGAVAEALREARQQATNEKSRLALKGVPSDGCLKPPSVHQSSRDRKEMSRVTSLRTDLDGLEAASQQSGSKKIKVENKDGTANGEKTNDEDRGERKDRTSRGDSQRKRHNESGRHQREGEMRTSSQRTNQTALQSTIGQRKPQNVQQVYLDSDYWYHKGVVLNQKQENQFALHCYE